MSAERYIEESHCNVLKNFPLPTPKQTQLIMQIPDMEPSWPGYDEFWQQCIELGLISIEPYGVTDESFWV